MVAGSEKRALWLNKDVKEAIPPNKDAFKAVLQNRSSFDLQSRYSDVQKTAAQAVKMSKQHYW